LVRLKVSTYFNINWETFISIPFGAIKSPQKNVKNC